MLIFLIFLLGIIFIQIYPAKENTFHFNYCSPKQTASINGIFTILIFLSHASQYVILDGSLDAPYLTMRTYMAQLVVVSFLFFSGFGIMESIKKKGQSYIKSILTTRLFKVWYHFAIALLPYVVVNFIFNRNYGRYKTVFSFTGYTSIGNSNWYMLVTFALYIIVFLAFMFARNHLISGVFLVFVLTFLFAFWEWNMGLASRYYNTIFCFPAGMLFSMMKPSFDKYVMKNDAFWMGTFCLFFGAFYYFSTFRNTSLIHYNVFSILAVFLIILLTMKIKITNPALNWFGNHVFSVFMLQRIPMIILKEMGYAHHTYGFIITSFVVTIFLSMVFDELMKYLDSLIFSYSH